MNEKQKLFVIEYLKDFNGTRAYKVAYPECSDESARTNASRLLTNDNIQQAIREQADKRLGKAEVDVEYIISNIKEVVERCMQKEPVMYFDKVDKEYKQETTYVEHEDGTYTEEGVWKFDGANSLKGLELLGKYKNIFKENINISGSLETEKQKNAIDSVVSQMKPLKEDDT